MSYCRWSSDNWASDVYVYEDVGGGWTTHVAASKLDHLPTPELDIMKASPEAWLESHNKSMDELRSIARHPIDLPHAGETFNDPTPGACADRLSHLKELGYHVPDYAIEELRSEHRMEIFYEPDTELMGNKDVADEGTETDT